jgi:Flp pilus assembly protein TadG
MRHAGAFARNNCGSIAVEAAILVPMFMIIVAGSVEVARAYQQANAVEKGLRAGALFLARAEDPDDSAAQASAINLVRTGLLDGIGEYLAPGWSDTGSSVTASVRSFSLGNNDSTDVIRIEAALVYTPLLPQFAQLFGLDNLTIRMSHEQAYVGF